MLKFCADDGMWNKENLWIIPLDGEEIKIVEEG